MMSQEKADRWSRPVEQLVAATHGQHAPLVDLTMIAVDTSLMNHDTVREATIAVCKALRQMGVGSAEVCFFDWKVRESVPFKVEELIDGTVDNVFFTVEYGMAPGDVFDYLMKRAPGNGTLYRPVFEHAKQRGAKTVFVVSDMVAGDLGNIDEELRPAATVWVALFAQRGPTRPFGWKVEFPHA